MDLDYLLASTLVFAVNLLPAFGPPTWAVLVFMRLNSDLAAVPLMLVGALAAALGRLTLATGAGIFAGSCRPGWSRASQPHRRLSPAAVAA